MKEIRALKPVKNAWLVRVYEVWVLGEALRPLGLSPGSSLYGSRIVCVTPVASTSVTDSSSTRTTL